METSMKTMGYDQVWLPTRFLAAPVQKLLARTPTQPWEGKLIFPEVDGGHPAVRSDSSEFIAFQRDFRAAAMEAIPPSTATDGLFDERGVATPFTNCSYIAGYAMTPVTVPPVDNTEVVPGLANGFLHPEDQLIYDALFDECWNPSNHKDSTTHFSKLASTGAPFRRTNHPAFKKAIIEAITGVGIVSGKTSLDHRFHRLCELLLASKFDEAADKFGASCLHLLGFRRQSSDSVTFEDGVFRPKDRLVNDVEYALSSGKRGHRFPASREIYINGELVPDMFAQRARTVWGAPGWMTYPFTAWLSRARKGYFERFEFTWKHHGAEDIERKLRTFAVVENLDVSQYDQSFRPWLVKYWIDSFRKFLPETTVRILELMYRSAYYVPNPDVNGIGGCVIGMPDRDNELHYGLPSGIAINPDMGKFHVPWALMTIAARAFDVPIDSLQSAREFVIQFMTGEFPEMAILNAGDDTVMCYRSREARDLFNEQLSASANYFKMEPEAGGSFLGNVIVKSTGGVRVVPNIISAYANWFMAERGVDHPSRKDYWSVGWMQREALYSTAPTFEIYERVLHDCWVKHFHHSPDEWATIAGGTMGLSDKNALVAAKPDLLEWRFDPDDPDLDPDLVANYTASLSSEETEAVAEVLQQG